MNNAKIRNLSTTLLRFALFLSLTFLLPLAHIFSLMSIHTYSVRVCVSLALYLSFFSLSLFLSLSLSLSMIVLGMFYLGINTFLLALCGSALKENRFARPTNIEKFKYDVRGCRELAFCPPRHVESVSKLCTSKRTERCLTVEARDTDYNFFNATRTAGNTFHRKTESVVVR